MTLNKFFYSVSSLLLLVGVFIFASTYFVAPDLMYPVRVDSLYVKYESEHATKAASHDTLGKALPVLFNPSSLGMKYEDFDVKTADGLTLRGWYVENNDEEANTLLIIHDLNQSKVNYLNMMKQMNDRGLNVCAIDMRAHGTSGGVEFLPGMLSVMDLKNTVDSLLKKKHANHIILFGSGIGAAVAIQAASIDERLNVLISQSPFSDFSVYVGQYSKRKWGNMSVFFHPVLERLLEKKLQYELTDLDLSEVIKYVKIPSLFICGGNDLIVPPIETYAVYDSSGAKEKNLIQVPKAGHDNIEQIGGVEYYNTIAQFIANSMPKKPGETRFKKLALQ